MADHAKVPSLEQQVVWLTQQLQLTQAALSEVKGRSLPHGLRPAKPSKFRGTREEAASLHAWLFGLEQRFEAEGVTNDVACITYAAMLLEGTALSWWMYVRSAQASGASPAPSTWQSWRAALLARFQPVNQERAARDRLAALR
jgi:hypothetical protein